MRVCAAADTLTLRLQAARDDVALAFLATPTDVFAVPADAVAQSARAYADRSIAVKLASRPLRTLSGGRLLRRAYRPDADPGINDSLVAQQGPNYALAKRLQRWRASVARENGSAVSLNVAPPTRTRSVVKNRALAAAYAGAHRFGAEVFEPDTCRVLMAALLVHDLHAGGGPGACSSLAGRGVRGRPWRALADRLRTAQRARARGTARLRRSQDLTAPADGLLGRQGYLRPWVAVRPAVHRACCPRAQLAGPDSRPDSRGPRTVISTSPAASTRQAQIAPPRVVRRPGRPDPWRGRAVGQRPFGDQQVGHRPGPAECAAEDGREQQTLPAMPPRLRSRARVPPGIPARRGPGGQRAERDGGERHGRAQPQPGQPPARRPVLAPRTARRW